MEIPVVGPGGSRIWCHHTDLQQDSGDRAERSLASFFACLSNAQQKL